MLNFMAISSVAAAMLVAPVSTPSVVAATAPPAERITVTVATVNGSGCPAGTAAVAAAADNTAFTVTYSNYLAQVGVGAKPTDLRKNCQLSVQVGVPAGFTFAIAQADYRGFASLAAGATGTQRANYYFQGTSPTLQVAHSFSGPMNDDWQTTDTTLAAAYAPCGELRNVNINTELRVAVGTSDPTRTTSFMAMDSTDVSVNTVYHLVWEQC
jgi:hypothetical protein